LSYFGKAFHSVYHSSDTCSVPTGYNASGLHQIEIEMDSFGTSMAMMDGQDGGQQSGLRLPGTTRTAFSPQAEQQIIRAMDKNKFNTILIVRMASLRLWTGLT